KKIRQKVSGSTARRDLRICEESIRKTLYASLPEFAEHQPRLSRVLAGRLSRALRRWPQRLAIDVNLILYHAKHFHHPKEVYRGQAKDGTLQPLACFGRI